MKKRKIISKKMMAVIALMMAVVMCMPVGIPEVKADSPDAKTTLQSAFDKFDKSEKVFAEYTVKVNSEGTIEVLTHELVEIDRVNNVKNIQTEDPDTHKMLNMYTDLTTKITYSEDASDGSWQKFPSEAGELEGIGSALNENGVETKISDTTVYSYDGEEKITISNPATKKEATYDCYRFKAVVILTHADSEDEDDEDDEDDEEDEEDDNSDADDDPDTVDVYYYVTKDTNQWVHAEIKEGIMVSVDIGYPTKEEEATVVVEIPKVAIETAVIADGYVTPKTSEEDVSYEVKYKGNKAYLAVSKVSSKKKKITVKASVKILDQTLQVTEISSSALANKSKLETVVVNGNITKIGSKAFYNSKKLKSITFKSKKIKSVGKNAFDTGSKKLKIKLAGTKKYKKIVTKLINKSRAKKAKKKTKLTIK